MLLIFSSQFYSKIRNIKIFIEPALAQLKPHRLSQTRSEATSRHCQIPSSLNKSQLSVSSVDVKSNPALSEICQRVSLNARMQKINKTTGVKLSLMSVKGDNYEIQTKINSKWFKDNQIQLAFFLTQAALKKFTLRQLGETD